VDNKRKRESQEEKGLILLLSAEMVYDSFMTPWICDENYSKNTCFSVQIVWVKNVCQLQLANCSKFNFLGLATVLVPTSLFEQTEKNNASPTVGA
jgi:hypothetical protein